MTLFQLFGVTFLILSGCNPHRQQSVRLPDASEAVTVKVIPIQRSAGTMTIAASGQLTTDDETVLSFKTGGVVQSVRVKEGDPIKKGQILATLNLTELDAQVEQIEKNYEKVQRDLERYKNLYQDSAATLEQVQNATTALQIVSSQMKAARFNRDFSNVRAPADGYVTGRFINPGQIIAAGSRALLTNGAMRGHWMVQVSVTDRQWVAIKAGDEATIKTDAFPGRSFAAVVSDKSAISDAVTGTFTVWLKIKSDGAGLASGMFASAEIRCGEVQSCWKLPYEAVLDANGHKGYVFVTNDGRSATRQEVVIESFDNSGFRISGGLEDAGSVIISGSAYLKDHSSIQIVN